jgi:hypothetical protein
MGWVGFSGIIDVLDKRGKGLKKGEATKNKDSIQYLIKKCQVRPCVLHIVHRESFLEN